MTTATPAGRRHLAVAALAVLLGAADTYVVVLVLPDLMSGIGLDSTELHRAAPLITGFLLGYVCLLPAAGRLSDLVGRMPVLLGCLALFTAGAVVTATAHGLGHAVAGRVLQGVGAGGLVPATLALVADGWPAARRALPLGVVGGVQEAGAVLGPLVGAAVLIVGPWRAVFWGAAALSAALAFALPFPWSRLRADLPGAALALAAVSAASLRLVAPSVLTEDLRLGELFVASGLGLSPLTLVALVLSIGFLLREVTAARPLIAVRGLGALLHAIDAGGVALLAGALAGVVLAFAEADPERSALADSAPYSLTASSLCLGGFVLRQRRASLPLIPPRTLRPLPVAGALVVSALVGVALVAVLVDVPVLVRATVDGSTQLDAALVLVRFLGALPVGAVLGGLAVRRLGAAPVSAAGLLLVAASLWAMGRWDSSSLDHAAATTAVLVLAGLGFGLAVAPVNSAALAATRASEHGLVASLVVVARTIGMLVGLSVLSAVGLRVFATRVARIDSPVTLCPDSPADCPAFRELVSAAVVAEVQVIFMIASACAVLAAVASITLRSRRKA